jgi:hypothetical protein
VGESDTDLRRRASDKYVPAQLVLQVFGALLLMIVAALTWDTYKKVDGHEGRIIRVEEQTATATKQTGEFKDDMRRLNDKIDRIAEAVGAKKP